MLIIINAPIVNAVVAIMKRFSCVAGSSRASPSIHRLDSAMNSIIPAENAREAAQNIFDLVSWKEMECFLSRTSMKGMIEPRAVNTTQMKHSAMASVMLAAGIYETF